MQFKEKLISQTWNNGKKTNFRPDFCLLEPDLSPQNFFGEFNLYYYLPIVPNYHPMLFQGKLTNQTWDNGKNPSFGSDFDTFWPKFDPKVFFVGFTSARYYTLLQAIILSNIKENQWIKLEKMAENLVLGPILAPLAQIYAQKHFLSILSLLDVRNQYKLSLYAISRKTNGPNLRKWQKT